MASAPARTIVAHVAATDTAKPSLEAIYREHKQFVYQTALRFTGGRRDCAEDVVQGVFMRVAKHLDSLQYEELRGWLYTVTMRLAFSELRNERAWYRRLAQAWSGTSETTDAVAPKALVDQEDAARALATLQQLPAEHLVVAVLAFVDEMSQTNIAKSLGISEAKVSRILAKARSRIAGEGWALS